MNEELLYQVQLLQQEAEKINSQLETVDQQLTELSSFTSYLNTLSTTKEKDTEILASIGKGIYAKTALIDKDLYVEVGSGVVLKKTPSQVNEVIENQVKKLKEIRIQLLAQKEICFHAFQELLEEMRSQQQEKQTNEHEHVHTKECHHEHEEEKEKPQKKSKK